MLYCLEAPRQGGETQLADMYGAYEALTDEMKMYIGSFFEGKGAGLRLFGIF